MTMPWLENRSNCSWKVSGGFVTSLQYFCVCVCVHVFVCDVKKGGGVVGRGMGMRMGMGMGMGMGQSASGLYLEHCRRDGA